MKMCGKGAGETGIKKKTEKKAGKKGQQNQDMCMCLACLGTKKKRFCALPSEKSGAPI